MPKIQTTAWTNFDGSPHPVSGLNDGPYTQILLGEILGLSQFGVHLERLPPGSRSSHRHWHENKDEFVYLISGELVLIEDRETLLKAGDAAGWKAGQPIAHCLENRSGHDAVLLVVGTRLTQDIVHYPDHDMVLHRDGGDQRYARADGTPVNSEH